MPRCAGKKPDGSRCTAVVDGPFCYQHDPSRADERRRNASRAGRARSSGAAKEIATLKWRLTAIAGGVLAGDVDPRVGAVAVQALNAVKGAIELERKIKEQDDIEARIKELEEHTGAL